MNPHSPPSAPKPKTTSDHCTISQHTQVAPDGMRIAVRSFVPLTKRLATVVLVHGYLEHSGRYEAFARALAAQGIAVVAADLRGHGLSDGPRGHVHDFGHYHQDLFEVITQARLSAGPLPLFLMGHSLGGLIVLDYALRRAPQLAGLVVTNPFIAPSMVIPKAKLWLGKVMQRVWPTLAVPAGLDSAALTGDLSILEAARADPLIFDRTTARWFHETTSAQARVAQGGALAVPFLGVLGMQDAIASPQASLACFKALHAPEITVWQRPDERHEVLNEINRQQLFDDIAAWLRARI